MLLTTKLFAPQLLSHHLPRPRLHARLERSFTTRLALVSAPAGFGKSTLLSEWIAEVHARGDGVDFAWLSLDEQDNEATRFYTHMLTALHQADEMLGRDLQTLSLLPQLPSSETLMSALINDAAQRRRPLVLVLDDYHVIDNPDLDKALIFLVEHAPQHLHLILATRADPPFPLARWRVRGMLLEIREQDLRFRHDEIAAFLRQAVDLEISSADVATIEERTEGWIGALQLAALSMQGAHDLPGFLRKLNGSHVYIVDYLVQEVLDQQPAAIRSFLTQTSVLDRMCGDLCSAVTGIAESDLILQRLYRQNLFMIALDEEQSWYRYHHLFAEMLRARLRRSSPQMRDDLLRQASLWCEANGWLGEAIHYALAVPDYLRAVQLIERHYWHLLERSEFAQLGSWIRELPQELVRTRPLLSLAKAWTLYNHFPDGEVCLDDVERLVQDRPGAAASTVAFDKGRLWSEVITLRATNAMFAGDSDRAIELAHVALERDAEQRALIYCANTLALAYSYYNSGQAERAYEWAKTGYERSIEARLPLLAALNQDVVLLYLERTGAFEVGEEMIRRIIANAADGDALATFMSTSARFFLGRYLIERFEVDAATEQLLVAMQLARRSGIDYLYVECHIQLMYARQAQGRWQEAQSHMRQVLELSYRFSDYYREWHNALVAHVWLLQGDVDQAAAYMATVGVSGSDEVSPHKEPEASILARLLYAQGRLDEALDLADRLRVLHVAIGRVKREMEMWCLRALVLWQRQEAAGALHALGQALAIGERCRFLHALLTMPPDFYELLNAYCLEPAAPYALFARRLLAIAGGAHEAVQPLSRPDALLEPLSDRELEVLQLVALGLSDRQIADQITVAPGTVKRHLNNIYGKLGVHSRTQALVRARSLHLLAE